MIKYAVLLLVIAVTFYSAGWAFIPRRHLPGDRIRYQNLRLAFRLHPGRGHVTVMGITAAFGRWAMWRRSSRIRPGLSTWERWRNPDAHSFLMGRAQYGRKVRMPLQEHCVILAEPRTGKTQAMARWIFRHPGSCLVVSTRSDLFEMSSGLRAARGPVAAFSPQGIGGLQSSIAWDLVRGCSDPATAIRRATGLAEAADTSGTEDSSFWESSGVNVLRALLMAADLAGGDLRLVYYWALGPSACEAVQILEAAGRHEMALPLAEHVNSPAQKTTSTVKMILAQMFGFMGDPALACSVLPAEGEGFDFPEFIRSNGTLYMVGSPDGATSPMAALFSCLVMEMRHHVIQIGSRMDGGRMDPPCAFFFDEATGIAPVDIPTILQDAAGFGLIVYTVAHGESQLQSRWDKEGAQTIMNNSAFLLLPGISAHDTLEHSSNLCGNVAFKEKGDDGKWVRHPVITPEMIRSLPARHGLLLRGSCRPVIIRLGMGYKDRAFKRAVRAGAAKAELRPAITRATSPVTSGPAINALPQHATVQGLVAADPEAACLDDAEIVSEPAGTTRVITPPARRVRRAWDARGPEDD